MKTIKIRGLKSVAFVICLFFLACQKSENSSGAKGTSLNIYLTDDPSLVFDHVFLDITKVEIKVEDDTNPITKVNTRMKRKIRTGMEERWWMDEVDIHPGVYDILSSGMAWTHYLATLHLMQ